MALAGRQSLLAAYEGERLQGVGYLPTVRRLPERELLARAVVVERLAATQAPEQARMAGPYSLPPGRYHVRVWRRDTVGGRGGVWVRFDQGPGVLAEMPVTAANPAVMALDLPVEVSRLWVGTDDEVTWRSVTAIEIAPLTITPRAERATVPRFWSMDKIGGQPGRFALFMDRRTWSEPGGYWVRGESRGEVWLSPAGAREMLVRVQNGAAAGRVTVSTPGRDDELSLGSWETRELAVSLSGRELLVPLVVSAGNGFRPAAVDPESTDIRFLCCWLTVGFR
jgi:hypothetical protein